MPRRSIRYNDDLKFRAEIDREKATARGEAKLGGWITYAIHDPTTPDTVGGFNTLIIYVGQTKEFGVRVDSRLRSAGTAVRRPKKWIDGALWDVMARGRVPRFRVIERVDDAIASFVSETNWAKRYIEQGYPLRNKWVEQQFAGKPIDRETVPHDWLWRLAVEDAIEARFDLILQNKTSGEDLIVDLSLWRPKELLRTVRDTALRHVVQQGHKGSARIAIR
jgi:hypothetical protein